MNAMPSPASPSSIATTRRAFLKTSGQAVLGAALAGAVARPGYAAENNTIKIALVGCGGRGSGATAQALSTQGPTKLWAAADVFDDRLSGSLSQLSQQFNKQIEVPRERQFLGMDAFKHAIDSLDQGDVVILTTPPAFRPIHLEYAVQKGVNVFMEKSFAVDPPGIRRVLRLGEEAKKKKLKIGAGLMSRHSKPLEEAIAQIHGGLIGDVITSWAYRMHGPVGFSKPRPGESVLAHQVRNYSNFTWLNGSFIVDWLIHNIDVACWVMNGWPTAVQGMGGRQVRRDPDQLFDHYMAEYTFADGNRMVAQGRHISKCWDFWGVIAQGCKGSAILGEGQANPRIFKGLNQTSENVIWQYKGPPANAYQYEHDLLFAAIRNDQPHNEAERAAKGCLAAIMGRMACESGKRITWEEALASNVELAPGLDNLKWGDDAPVMPHADGSYDLAMPGQTAVL